MNKLIISILIFRFLLLGSVNAGNVVDPSEIMNKYGSDTARLIYFICCYA